jgi:hypothetical protein
MIDHLSPVSVSSSTTDGFYDPEQMPYSPHESESEDDSPVKLSQVKRDLFF